MVTTSRNTHNGVPVLDRVPIGTQTYVLDLDVNLGSKCLMTDLLGPTEEVEETRTQNATRTKHSHGPGKDDVQKCVQEHYRRQTLRQRNPETQYHRKVLSSERDGFHR